MKYRELVSFEPVKEIMVLTAADDLEQARSDVSTYVISERMAEHFRKVILPRLRFDQPGDKKCMFVVATYGTGKTHLMSVISAVAEHQEFAALLTNSGVATDAAAIAGTFKVIRAEIGSTKMSLRDIICHDLEAGLAGLGVDFHFPDAATVTNTKDSLIKMMETFDAQYPDKGLLYVLDELLDYLAGRKDLELREDLAILREIGEVSSRTKLRFIAGVQEAIYDNPRFRPVADSVRRIRDRYEQIRIVREDVAYVVKERLLQKNVEQRDTIRRYLIKFAPAFDGMAEHMDEFVDLFPIHPAYLRVFEAMTIVEKRRILVTLGNEMERRLDDEVPQDVPGLICYDTYRCQLENDPSNRMIEDVRIVLEKAAALRNRVEKAMVVRADVPMAMRIIDGLAIHRLTTGDDIYARLGPTTAELRDDLCLMAPGLPADAVFIQQSVATVVDEIVKTVSGQFISVNGDNGQVFLDVKKDIDYDQKIEERASSLDKAKLDDAYFRALEQVLEQRDQPYKGSYNIWLYPVRWPDKRVTRLGYLFFGTPGERSTAHPPRDFYLYFIQPYDPPAYRDEAKPDEVFFRLEAPDAEFTRALRRYAGASALEDETGTAATRAIYRDKHQAALGDMASWLRKHMGEAVSVTYRADTKTIGERLALLSIPRGSVKDTIDAMASSVLAPQFESRYPGYPAFSVDVTLGQDGNLGETVRQCISQIVTRRATTLSAKVLASLGLVDPTTNDLLDTGPYASALLAALGGAGGRALNRSDLLVERDKDVWTWGTWHLEPAWLTVVAATLCQMGKLEIGFPAGQIDALQLDKLTKMSIDELEDITHVAPPKATPVTLLRDAARFVDINPGEIPATGATEDVVSKVIAGAASYAVRIAAARDHIVKGVDVWGSDAIEQKDERLGRLDALQKLVDDLKARNSIGKMNKLAVTPETLAAAETGRRELLWIEAVAESQGHLAKAIEYLRDARRAFGDGDDIATDADAMREQVLAAFRTGQDPDPVEVSRLRGDAERLQRRYADAAARAHRHDRLDAAGEQRKRRILEGQTYRDLQILADVTLLPGDVFRKHADALTAIRSCPTFDEKRLQTTIRCPDCGYEPHPSVGPSVSVRLGEIETRMSDLHHEWGRVLVESFSAPEMAEQIKLLDSPEELALIHALITTQKLPDPLNRLAVETFNEALTRFELEHIGAADVWAALFPQQGPATLSDLRTRFDGFIADLRKGRSEDKIRVVPSEEPPE